MKRKDLIKLMEKNGWYFKRRGGNHDIYTDGKNIEPVSRQTEIKESVAQAITSSSLQLYYTHKMRTSQVKSIEMVYK